MVLDSELTSPARLVSFLLGWLYFLSWSLSFYPQPYKNWHRRSTEGLSVDFSLCNLLGFSAYSLYSTCLLYSSTIRHQYAQRHVNSPVPAVRLNDLVYCIHGLLMIVVVYSQFWPGIWGFKVGACQKASRRMIGICTAGLGAVFLVFLFAVLIPSEYQYLDVIYACGNLKVFLTIIKYVPQMVMNFKRQSTSGWSIEAILLDFIGGCLSIIQLFIDVSLSPDWSGLVGNPAKLLLGNVTLFFDVVFLVQHFILYRKRIDPDPQASDEAAALLDGRS